MNTLFNVSPTAIPPALWGMSGEVKSETIRRIVECYQQLSTSKSLETLAEPWLAMINDSHHGLIQAPSKLRIDDALLALAAAHALLNLDVLSSHHEACQQLEALGKAARSLQHLDDVLLVSLGVELSTIAALADAGQANLPGELVECFEALVEQNLDSDGWPNSSSLKPLAALAGSWARMFHLFRRGDIDIDDQVHAQLEWLVRQCLRLRRSDGSLGFCPPGSPSETLDDAFWQTLVSMSNDSDDALILKLLQQATRSNLNPTDQASSENITSAKSYKTDILSDLADPYSVSEWAESFLLRSTWSPDSPRIAVDFAAPFFSQDTDSQPPLDTEIARTEVLIRGQTVPEIQIDGELQKVTSEFEIVCEVHDDDLDYIELQAGLSTGSRFTRQYLLSRKREFLLIADSVVSNGCDTIEYRCRWPLAEGMTTIEESETREIYFSRKTDQTIQALVLPIALPEWKAERSTGNLQVDSEAMTLHQQIAGQALFAPLVFDLKPSRSKKKRTWRTLTVAEDRENVAPDQAVAYRFQLNNRQWFFYRALASTGNRTFLGQNVVSEFAFYRFGRQGKVTSLMEVE